MALKFTKNVISKCLSTDYKHLLTPSSNYIALHQHFILRQVELMKL